MGEQDVDESRGGAERTAPRRERSVGLGPEHRVETFGEPIGKPGCRAKAVERAIAYLEMFTSPSHPPVDEELDIGTGRFDQCTVAFGSDQQGNGSVTDRVPAGAPPGVGGEHEHRAFTGGDESESLAQCGEPCGRAAAVLGGMDSPALQPENLGQIRSDAGLAQGSRNRGRHECGRSDVGIALQNTQPGGGGQGDRVLVPSSSCDQPKPALDPRLCNGEVTIDHVGAERHRSSVRRLPNNRLVDYYLAPSQRRGSRCNGLASSASARAYM